MAPVGVQGVVGGRLYLSIGDSLQIDAARHEAVAAQIAGEQDRRPLLGTGMGPARQWLDCQLLHGIRDFYK